MNTILMIAMGTVCALAAYRYGKSKGERADLKLSLKLSGEILAQHEKLHGEEKTYDLLELAMESLVKQGLAKKVEKDA